MHSFITSKQGGISDFKRLICLRRCAEIRKGGNEDLSDER